MVDRLQRTLGCLLGGAVGDALGAAVEFWPLSQIVQECGAAGVTDYLPAYGHAAPITDDTQMTLFTAEGLMRAPSADADTQVAAVHRAYLRWLHTQQVRSEHPDFDDALWGWLLHEPVLHQRRAPGNTCIGGLARATPGTCQTAYNDSKGCGGVMRVAPIGLIVDHPFAVANRTCALTHGHVSGWLAGGAFAEMIAALTRGATLLEAVHVGRASVLPSAESEVRAAIDAALHAADSSPVSAQTVESLGAGWVAEEALAIGVYCALVAKDFRHGVSLAATHSGDSDSTAELTGQLLGTRGGLAAIDDSLLTPLEARSLIEQIATDLHGFATGGTAAPDRYPPDPPRRL